LVGKRLVDCEMHEKKDREDAEEEKRKGEAETNEANEKQQQGMAAEGQAPGVEDPLYHPLPNSISIQ
jgi:hypothetical protein